MDAAIRAVLGENLYGLEIDARCTQIAAFNVALAAWRLARRPIELPPLHIACAGLSVGGTREQWLRILEGQGNQGLRFFFGQLYDLFRKGPTLGSLINPHRFLGSGMLDKEGMEGLFRALSTAVAEDMSAPPERHELGVAAQGLAKATELLAGRYTLVITNVPYLARGKQDAVLKEHLETQYSLGKADLATAFVLRCLEFCGRDGTTALVTPQNWLFLTTYTKLRGTLLDRRQWNLIARLGPKSFRTPMWDFNIQLGIITATTPSDEHTMTGIDVSAAKQPDEKAALLRGADFVLVPQAKQIKNVESRVLFVLGEDTSLLSSYADFANGLQTGDYVRYVRYHWEGTLSGSGLRCFQSTVDTTTLYHGCEQVIYWPDSGASLVREQDGAVIRGTAAWGNRGVAVSAMSDLKVALYLGELYDDNIVAIIPKSPSLLAAIWCLCASPEYSLMVRRIDQALKVRRALIEVPFDLPHWQKVAAEKYPNGLPEPESDDPTQWLFHGWPVQATAPLQVAVARLLGYRWLAERDRDMRLSQRARALVQRCDELLPFGAPDGIVCIPSVRGEETASDRLLTLLSACGIRPDRNLDDWLRNDFFEEHCKLFDQRPFIWHLWDGRKDGFHALVSYHRLTGLDGEGRRTLEALTYSHLGDWIERQQTDQRDGQEGADARLAAAQSLQGELKKILNGEPPYDLFVRWKPLREQAIGWKPDVNDGVRVNIRPFLLADTMGLKGAGILRWKPNISWKKDRGREPKRPFADFPWFWGWDGSEDFVGGTEFTGERFNDCHYTTEFKHQARQQAR